MTGRLRNIGITTTSLLGYKMTEEKWVGLSILAIAVVIFGIYWLAKHLEKRRKIQGIEELEKELTKEEREILEKRGVEIKEELIKKRTKK